MVFTFHQMTGMLRDEATAEIVGAGYSGHGDGRNNALAEAWHNVGPIPRGDYVLGEAVTHPRLGPVSMSLTPAAGTDTLGRGEFFAHGDSSSHPGMASDGCIVLALLYRQMLAQHVGATVRVIGGQE